MNDNEKLVLLQAMLGEPENEDVLFAYLTLAGKKILRKAYPFSSDITEVPAQYDTLQCEIAAYLLNKRGAEGQLSHNENGISRSYESADVPSSLLRQIIPSAEVPK